MNRALCILALSAATVVGCKSNKTSSIPMNDSVADISSPSANPIPAYQPTPQPVVYDSMTTTGTGSAISSGSYTIKKGDTLYSIARTRYGDGKQWTRIASANPGLRPEALKVGQTITIP